MFNIKALFLTKRVYSPNKMAYFSIDVYAKVMRVQV